MENGIKKLYDRQKYKERQDILVQRDVINLLFTFDQNYISPFKVLVSSLLTSNPDEQFHIWLLYREMQQEYLQELDSYCKRKKLLYTAIPVDSRLFEQAPVMKQYPREMYYRLMAPHILPDSVERILYLDPDILVINPIRPLWETDLSSKVFAAASHSGVFNFGNQVNKARLNTNHDYFNSGVILMDLKQARVLVKPSALFECVDKHADELVLPDQDVFNYLYGSFTLSLDDSVWNYDARYYKAYYIRSEGKCDIDWVMSNTVLLHFCGKQKPWKKYASGRFAILYKHYQSLTDIG